MAARLTEAVRLARHNAEMKLALAENITVIEARRRISIRTWREFEERVARRKRCGTVLTDCRACGTDLDGPSAAGAEDGTCGHHSTFSTTRSEQPHFWWHDQ